jgi:plasmid stabilization system protein ParE
VAELIISPLAEEDMDAIWFYIAEDNSEKADYYLLFYRSINTGIELARVLHSSRDIPNYF